MAIFTVPSTQLLCSLCQISVKHLLNSGMDYLELPKGQHLFQDSPGSLITGLNSSIASNCELIISFSQEGVQIQEEYTNTSGYRYNQARESHPLAGHTVGSTV